MAKRDGEVTPEEAARCLEVDPRTVRSWCDRAVAGEPSKVSRVRRDPAGRYYIPRAEVRRILSTYAQSIDDF